MQAYMEAPFQVKSLLNLLIKRDEKFMTSQSLVLMEGSPLHHPVARWVLEGFSAHDAAQFILCKCRRQSNISGTRFGIQNFFHLKMNNNQVLDR